MTSPVALDGSNSVRGLRPAVADIGPTELHHGYYQLRPTSQDGWYFRATAAGPVVAYSRILMHEEVVVVANRNAHEYFSVDVMLDDESSRPGDQFRILYSNHDRPVRPGRAIELRTGSSLLVEPDGTARMIPLLCFRVTLAPEEVQILSR